MKRTLLIILASIFSVSLMVGANNGDVVKVKYCVGNDQKPTLQVDGEGGYICFDQIDSTYLLYSDQKKFKFIWGVENEILPKQQGKQVSIESPKKNVDAVLEQLRFYSDAGIEWHDFEHSWGDSEKAYLNIMQPQPVKMKIQGLSLSILPIPKEIEPIKIYKNRDYSVELLDTLTIKTKLDTLPIITVKRFGGTRFIKVFYKGTQIVDSLININSYNAQKIDDYDRLEVDSATINIDLRVLPKAAQGDSIVIQYQQWDLGGKNIKELNHKLIVNIEQTDTKHQIVLIIVVAIVLAVIIVVFIARKLWKKTSGNGNGKDPNSSLLSTSTEKEDGKEENDALKNENVSTEKLYKILIDGINALDFEVNLPKVGRLKACILSKEIKAIKEEISKKDAAVCQMNDILHKIETKIIANCANERENSKLQQKNIVELNQKQGQLIDQISLLQDANSKLIKVEQKYNALIANKEEFEKLLAIGEDLVEINSLNSKIDTQQKAIDKISKQLTKAEGQLKELEKDNLKQQQEFDVKLSQKQREHETEIATIAETHKEELQKAEEQRLKDIETEKQNSRSKIEEWYKDKEFCDANLKMYLDGIERAINEMYYNVPKDNIYYYALSRSVTTLNMLKDCIKANAPEWELKGTSHIYKFMQDRLREQLSDKTGWINHMLRLYCFSSIDTLRERMQDSGISFALLDNVYRNTVLLLNSYGITVKLAALFIDDYDNEAVVSYFNYNNVDSTIESYTGLAFLREQKQKADGRKIVMDMSKVAYFYKSNDDIILDKGEITYFY